jgi:hypothetical protein
MGIEREHDRPPADRASLLDKPGDEMSVPAMHPIEISDRKGSASQRLGQIIKLSQQLHAKKTLLTVL